MRCYLRCKKPLFGSEGAAYVYARQKGADNAAIELLDEGLKNIAQVVAKNAPKNLKNGVKNTADTEGSGAAGGLGFGAQVFLQATLRRGIDLILDLTNFDNLLNNNNLIITGEGRLDSQTAQGKLIMGIAERARKAHVPVIAFCGALEASGADIKNLGLLATFPIGQKPTTLAKALETTGQNLEKTAFNVARIFNHFVR
ncbi:MAG: glycerate kinase, partial [Saprospiraceae bacterium]|nr:glycerate kinase [Saprospiraceae bacterium]